MSKINVTIDGVSYDVEVRLNQAGDPDVTVEVGGETLNVTMPRLDSPDQLEWVLVDGRPYEIVVDRHLRWIKSAGGLHRLEMHDLLASDDHAVALLKSSGERDGTPYSSNVTHVWHVADGKATEFWGLSTTPYEDDEFWS